MNDKELFKKCLVYMKRGMQTMKRPDLIKALEERLKEPEANIMIKHKGTTHKFTDIESALVFMRGHNGTDWK